jgi:L-alanine-DL-glutamate epimerase-like enolase superfamily enzyme
MLESRLGISVAAHLAAGVGGFAFIDLDGHLLTAEPRATGGFEQSGERLRPLTDVPGHGAAVALS